MHSLDVLEFDAIRSRLASRAETAIGGDIARQLAPTFDADEVWSRLELTAEAHALIGKESPPSLGAIRDVRSALTRAEKGFALGGQEIYEIGSALSAMRGMKRYLDSRRGDFPRLWPFVQHAPEAPRLEDSIFASVEGSGEIKDSASPELSRIRQKIRSTQSKIVDRVQSYVSGKAREWLSDPIYTTREGRYVIPLKAEHKGKIRGIVHDSSASGQTVYIEPEDVLQMGNALREAESAEREECERVLTQLSALIGTVAELARDGIESTGELDFVLACARLAYDLRGALPKKWDGHGIALTGARHPMLDPDRVVPVTITVGFGDRGLLITGPNTGGKTVAIKCVGLCALMAQSGLFPPADEVKLGPFSQVWADIGDEQSLQQSLSTFSGHIRNIADALKHLRPGALVLFDEIGAGTDPAEGAALAKAILSELTDRGAIVLASTHYGELKAFAYNTPGFQNAAMEFDVKSLRPTYRLIMGAPGASHALKIAERYGIPGEVVAKAKESLGSEAEDVGLMMEKLELAQRQSRIAQSDADKRLHELRKVQETAERKLKEADEIRRTVHAQASAQIEATLRELRLEAEEIFEELKKAKVDERVVQAARTNLKALQSLGQEAKAQFEVEPEEAPDTLKLEKGCKVKVEGYPQPGVLLDDPAKSQVAVQIGPLRITVASTKLTPVESLQRGPQKAQKNLSLQKAMSVGRELHIRARRAEEALEELEKFLDDALLAGCDSVRIVHGKGEGILRGLVRERLRKHPHIASYREGEPGEGGHGVTIAVLR